MNAITVSRIVPQLIAIVMLSWAVVTVNPYGYYMVLRWVCCAAFISLVRAALKNEQTSWAWIMAVLAGIYNPIVRVHASREFWVLVNLVTIAVVIASIFALKQTTQRKPS